MSIFQGVFPDQMKIAYVPPLLKKPSLCSDYLNNYRPVSYLSLLSKLVERVVCRQLTRHLIKCNLYVPVHSAYKSDYSTETALLKVVNDLLLALNNGDAAVLTLLDQSAAFDTAVDHGILLRRLSTIFGLSGTVLSWFESYLTGCLQCISISIVCSAAVLLLFGVPQCFVLEIVLFTLYNSPIHVISMRRGVADHLYSDYIQMYTTFTLDTDYTDQKLVFKQRDFICYRRPRTLRHYGRSPTRLNDVTFKISPLAAYLLQDRLQDRGFDLQMFERLCSLLLI
jgi:hypothetical protein